MTTLLPIRTDTGKPPRCRRCGEAMRLFGIESHPTIEGTTLRTYVCECCDAVQAVSTPPRNRIRAHRKSAAMPAPSMLANKAFDDETTSRLGAAYESAWRKLKASGSPLAEKSHAASTRERLAKCILEMGQLGETDSNRLVERALGRLASLNGGGAGIADL
jgi:hypothetical protein